MERPASPDILIEQVRSEDETRRDPRRSTEPGILSRTGLVLGTFFGVRIVIDGSLLIIFLLIATQLAWGLLPRWHPEWGLGLRGGVALVSATLFFASILLHELAHAWMARAFGMKVDRITLFLFGGVAQIDGEAPSPRAEFWIAAVGPLVSLAIGGLSLLIGSALVSGDALRDPERLLSTLGPASTLLFWLGPVNLVLALFNLVPGFPLDGGRVLRAALWWLSGDLKESTRRASRIGQGFAWFLMASGVAMVLGATLPWVGGGWLQGFWLLLIGWFLNQAARGSYQHLVLQDALLGVPVQDLMRQSGVSLSPEVRVDELVKEMLFERDERAFPVVDEGALIGLVTLSDIRRVPKDRWADTRVGEMMTPLADLSAVQAQDDAWAAFRVLSTKGVGQVPVLQGERWIGMVRREDLLRWLSFRLPGLLPAEQMG